MGPSVGLAWKNGPPLMSAMLSSASMRLSNLECWYAQVRVVWVACFPFFFFFLIYVSQNHAIPVEGKKTKSLVYFFFLL